FPHLSAETLFAFFACAASIQVFVKERGEWKIAESVVAPTEQIVQNGDGFGMKEEMVYGDRRENVK
ncbi:hypothetical protein ACT7CZ_19685, partial [Bacillus cereus]